MITKLIVDINPIAKRQRRDLLVGQAEEILVE